MKVEKKDGTVFVDDVPADRLDALELSDEELQRTTGGNPLIQPWWNVPLPNGDHCAHCGNDGFDTWYIGGANVNWDYRCTTCGKLTRYSPKDHASWAI